MFVLHLWTVLHKFISSSTFLTFPDIWNNGTIIYEITNKTDEMLSFWKEMLIYHDYLIFFASPCSISLYIYIIPVQHFCSFTVDLTEHWFLIDLVQISHSFFCIKNPWVWDGITCPNDGKQSITHRRLFWKYGMQSIIYEVTQHFYGWH